MIEILLIYNVIMVAVLGMMCVAMSDGNVFKLNIIEFCFACAIAVFWPVTVTFAIYNFFKKQFK